MAAATPLDTALLERIAEAIGSMRFGTIHITVHDARVVQIEKVERVRLVNRPSDRTPGGSRQAAGESPRSEAWTDGGSD